MKILILSATLLICNSSYAVTNLLCQVYNKDQLLTTQPLILNDKDLPTSWARNNPGQYAANQYKPTLCKSVGLGNEGYFTQANVNGRRLNNVQIYQQPYASRDCNVTCTPTDNPQTGNSQPLKAQDQNLGVAAQVGGYLVGR